MGYILPITRNTYKQYQIRLQPDDTSPHYIEKPFRILLEQLNDEETFYEEQEQHAGEGNEDSEDNEEKPMLQAFQIDAITRSQITGKGALFNDQV